MLRVYRCLLCLYPAEHRYNYSQEMASVFCDACTDKRAQGLVALISFYFRELAGLIQGAFGEHLQGLLGSRRWTLFAFRRFHMRSEFRFPKSTTALMVIILAGVVLAIEKAKAIQASLPYTHPEVGPIRPAQFTFFPTIALLFLCFYAAGAIGWAVLFALRRSGVHRLAAVSADATQK